MAESSRVVTLTVNPAVDKSSTIKHVVPERKLRCGEPRHEPGGGGINVSRALRILGGTSHAIYTAGGYTGEHLSELLAGEGVDCTAVPVSDWTRENLIVFEESASVQYRFDMPGPVLTDKEWEACLERVLSFSPAPAYLVASGSLAPGMPADFYAVLAGKARERGIRMVLDTTGEPLRLALSVGVYLVKPNMHELREFAEDELCGDLCMEDASMDIIGSGGAEAVVVSLGAAGSALATKEGVKRFRAPAVPVRSVVGAGDSMVAGIVHGLTLGEPVEAAAMRGVAAGSAAVMTHGIELCRRDVAERLLAQMSK